MSKKFNALLLAAGIATSVVGLTMGAFAGPVERPYGPPIGSGIGGIGSGPIGIVPPPPPPPEPPRAYPICADRSYTDIEGRFHSGCDSP